MWPTLISLGPLSLGSFETLLFLGLFFGSLKLWRAVKDEGWDERVVFDCWFLAAAAAFIAGRAGFVLQHPEIFSGSWYKMVFFTRFPGISGEFAWLGGTLFLIVYGIRQGLEGWRLAEIAAPGLLAAEIFLRLGMFLGGSNPGKAAPAGWALLVFSGSEAALWPVQLFWAAGLGLILGAVNYLEGNYRRLAPGLKPGFLAASYLILTGLLQLVLALVEAEPAWSWGIARLAAGGLILLWRSGITIKVPVKRAGKRPHRERGLDYA